MRCFLAVILCIAVPVLGFAADSQPSGSLANVKGGSDLRLYIDSTTVKFLKGKTEVAMIPVTAITEVSYGQDVHRRVGTAIGLGLLSFGVGAFMLFLHRTRTRISSRCHRSP